MNEREKLQNNICKQTHQGININVYGKYRLNEEMETSGYLLCHLGLPNLTF